jgi:predicted Zn-dependent protease
MAQNILPLLTHCAEHEDNMEVRTAWYKFVFYFLPIINKEWKENLHPSKLRKKPCVVSTYRMGKNYEDRLIKVSIHETGHTLGIPHCKNTKCVMTDAKGKGSTVDNASIWMCDVCKSKIKYYAKKYSRLFFQNRVVFSTMNFQQ